MPKELICDGCEKPVTVAQDFYCDACREETAQYALAEQRWDDEAELGMERLRDDAAERANPQDQIEFYPEEEA
jgi:predicted amidophosphoribosyltransferase